MGIAYRPEIDGLRAIAVLAVVSFHAGLGGAGFVGVDVFFVISGYLITALLLREWRTTQAIDLADFYARRVRRIFPAAAVVVLVVLGLSALLLAPDQQAHTSLSAGAALVFGANVFFQITSGGYFDGVAEEMPLLHLWSLSVEEQFYFLWPALLILVLRYRPQWLLPVMAGLGIASFVLAELLLASGTDAAFYQMPARFWELAAGGMIAAMPPRVLPRWVATAGLLLTLAACVWPLGHFPGVGAVPAVLGASMLIAAVHGGGSHALLRSRPMVGIGLISYSLYLWHWPLLAFYRATWVGEGSLQVRLILCAAAVLLAIASYRYVEQPFRRMRWPKGRTVAIGGALSASLAVAACSHGLQTQRQIAAPEMPPRTCHSMYTDAVTPKCVPVDGTRVGIWGDSMAYAWTPMAWQADAKGAAFSRDSCGPFVGYLPAPGDVLPKHQRCHEFNELVAAHAGELDTVILVARWKSYGSLDPLAATLHRLAKVRRVVILGPTPEMRESGPRCINEGMLEQCSIPRAAFDAEAEPLLVKLRDLAAPHANVEVVDLAGYFCTGATCPSVKGGVPLYWDTHHVSTTAVRAFRMLPEAAPASVKFAAPPSRANGSTVPPP